MIDSPHWEKLINSLLMAMVVALLYFVTRAIIQRKVKEPQSLNPLRTALNYTGLLMIIIMLACIWVAAIRPAFAFLGIVAAALAIAHKSAIMNWTGGLFISGGGLFSIGDRIQIGQSRGDVIGVGPMHFTLFEMGDAASGLQSTGCVLKIPNKLIFSTPIVNHSKFFPHVWHEIAIVLKSDANWVKAKAIFQQLTEKHTKAYEGSAKAAIQNTKNRAPVILYKTSPKIFVTLQNKPPAGIKLTSRYLCESHAIRETEVLISEDLLTRLNKEPDIAFASEGPIMFPMAEKTCAKEV